MIGGDILNTGNHIRTEMRLRIEAAGLRKQCTCFSIQQISHHSGSADINGKGIVAPTVGCCFNGNTGGKDHGTAALRQGHRHIPLHNGSAGEAGHAVHFHRAFSAGTPPTAGCIGMQTRVPKNFQQIGAIGRTEDPILGQHPN